jgi:2-polyprenyl-3-methyl-5-hydroxy-6-metoxy-1,4-benzoquinol methylase
MLNGRVSRASVKPLTYYKGLRVKADFLLHQQIADAVMQITAPPARVLDYGAGEGALSERLSDLGFDVLAVDVDEPSYQGSPPFARLDFNDAAAVEAFAEAYHGEFDVVLGIEVIEHVENPWQYIRDLARLVRPGGSLVVSTPNTTSWISRMSFLRTGCFYQFLDYDRAYGHINPVSQDELRLVMEESGLRVRSVSPGGWLPRLWLSRAPLGLMTNLVGFVLSFGMRGIRDGWCIIAVAEKPATV